MSETLYHILVRGYANVDHMGHTWLTLYGKKEVSYEMGKRYRPTLYEKLSHIIVDYPYNIDNLLMVDLYLSVGVDVLKTLGMSNFKHIGLPYNTTIVYRGHDIVHGDPNV